MTIRDNEPLDGPVIEQVTGYVCTGAMQVLAGNAGDAATTWPALRIFAMNVLLSLGIISLTVGLLLAQCGQSGRWRNAKLPVAGATA